MPEELQMKVHYIVQEAGIKTIPRKKKKKEKRPGADCDSDHELFIAKFRLKLKKVRKPLG